MNKKLILMMIVTVIFIVVSCVCVSAQEEEVITDGDYTYVVSNGEAMITNFNESVTGSITIPSTLGGYPVTSIGMWAFNSCTGLTSVTIPDSITNIGIEAFYWCKSLTSITIPNGVAYIERGAFRCCFSLESVTIPDSVVVVGAQAFESCSSLTSVTIGSGVTTIGYMAFNWCEKLTSIDIPNNVSSIGHSAFYNCGSLTTVNIGSGVTSIGGNAFSECRALTSIYVEQANESYCSVDGVLFNKNMTDLIVYPRKKADVNYKIPDGITTLHAYAFSGCNALTSVTIPDSVTIRYNYVFENCSALTSIKIPQNAAVISSGMFRNCTSLTRVTIPNGVTTIYDGAFHGCTSLKDVYFMGTPKEWNNVLIEENNSCLTNATIQYTEPYTHTTIVEEIGCKKYEVESYEIPTGSEIIIACYNNDVLVYLEIKKDDSENFTVFNNIIYDKVKIFVWNSFTNMQPITDAEEVE